jgi:hypothetical protein
MPNSIDTNATRRIGIDGIDEHCDDDIFNISHRTGVQMSASNIYRAYRRIGGGVTLGAEEGNRQLHR